MTWREWTFVVWGALGAALVGCGVLAWRTKGRLPDAGALIGLLTAAPVRRAVVVLAWMWLGWHLFAR